MNNKTFFTVVIILLVAIIAGSGCYIWKLETRLADYEDSLVTLHDEIASGLTSLDGKTAALSDSLDILRSDISELHTELAVLQEQSSVGLDASALYDDVSPSVVRVTDGSSTIGSGFIYDEQGRIITACHVVDEISGTFYIMMHDGRISHASLLASSRESDIAVLELQDNLDVQPVIMADSSLLRIGEPVIAIGSPGDGENPLGLRDTLTSGTVSQLNRYVSVEGNSVSSCIQFDAAVNFGNSGCALINNKGEVVGLVIARINPSVGDGINWAVSSNRVKKVADSLISESSFSYPWIGIGVTDLTPLIVEQLSLENSNGIIIVNIYENTPAQSAGFQLNDVIVSLDSLPVRDVDELVSFLVDYYAPGEVVTIGFIRENELMYQDVVLDAK